MFKDKCLYLDRTCSSLSVVVYMSNSRVLTISFFSMTSARSIISPSSHDFENLRFDSFYNISTGLSTTSRGFSQYYKVILLRQSTPFWRENVIAVVILLRFLTKMS